MELVTNSEVIGRFPVFFLARLNHICKRPYDASSPRVAYLIASNFKLQVLSVQLLMSLITSRLVQAEIFDLIFGTLSSDNCKLKLSNSNLL